MAKQALEAGIVSIGRRGWASWVAFELKHVWLETTLLDKGSDL